MQDISKAWCAHIDITNVCRRGCVYCTRFDRHLGPKKYSLSLPEVENALISYKDFPGFIGIMGGEPQFHPQFSGVCSLIRTYFPRNKVILFTSVDPIRSKWSSIIRATFFHFEYHPHNEEQEKTYEHQPLTIAIRDVVRSEGFRNTLINDCWVQRKWCPSITDDGAFFCEIGAGIAKLQGNKGWEVKEGWWKISPADFGAQLNLCQLCGMAIPMKRQKMSDKKQKISPSFLNLLTSKGLPTGDYELFDREITTQEMKEALPTWTPGVYRIEQTKENFQYSTLDWNNIK